MRSKPKILIVDDDATFVDFVLCALKNETYSVCCVKNADEALQEYNKTEYNLVITEVILPGMDGIKLFEKFNEIRPYTDVIFCTSYSSVESAVKALKDGAYDYLTKPVNADEFRLVIHRCLEQRKIFEENEELRKMVQLIESCKSLSSTFDKEKISTIALEVLVSEVKATAGFFVSYDQNDTDFDILSSKGISSAKSEDFLRLFPQYIKNWKKKKAALFHFNKDETNKFKEIYKSLKDGIVIKIQVNSTIKALIILLNNAKRGNFTPTRIKNAEFIVKETTLAFKNLDQYLGAKELAYIDDLTNLYNSRYLYLILDREIKRAKRFKTSLLVLFIDLDLFKKVNDTYGHLIGGKVLVEMAQVLTKCVREIDTMVRYGGDEYIIVLTETDLDTGMKVAERIRKGIEDHVFVKDEGLDIRLTACIGLAGYPEHAKTKRELIHFADMAMYIGKGTTKNAVYIATDKIKSMKRSAS